MDERLKSIANDIVLEAAGNTDLFTYVVCEDSIPLVDNWEELDHMIPAWYQDENQRDNLIKHVQDNMRSFVINNSNKIRGARVIAGSHGDQASVIDACLNDILFAADGKRGGGLDVLSKAVSMWNELLKLTVERVQSNYQLTLEEV